MEQDPVKYDLYEKAISKALFDKRINSSRAEILITVLVVGAGRGPLVQATLNASIISCTSVKIFAVDKNFNAVVTLRNRFIANVDKVSVLWCDMRELKRKYPNIVADIVVSELLGSWGDNELSPECLDSVEQDGLLAENGVMIPTSYESYIAPISASKLWMQARDKYVSKGKNGLDFPYVVNFHSCNLLAEAKSLFKVKYIYFQCPCTISFEFLSFAIQAQKEE
jgi:protein arginine N-methyltransferase 5